MKPLIYILLAAFCMTSSVQLHADDVKYRKASFQMIKYHFAPLGAMVKGKVPFDAATAKANADALVKLSHFPINGFKEKSITEKSRALPEIWNDWAGFEGGMSKFQAEAKTLSDSTGSLAQMKPAFIATAKTCKGCHKNYRKKK